MSTLTFADVDQILRIVDQFPAAEVRFEHGDLKLYVKRAGSGAAVAPPAGQTAPPTALQPALQHVSQPVSQPAAAQASPPAATASAAAAGKRAAAALKTDRRGQTSIESPLMGVYYASPTPDADPFVRPGQKIAKGADLCIIEVMKVMNNIRAPFAGIVVDVTAENGAMVEQGQALMWIMPEGDA